MLNQEMRLPDFEDSYPAGGSGFAAHVNGLRTFFVFRIARNRIYALCRLLRLFLCSDCIQKSSKRSSIVEVTERKAWLIMAPVLIILIVFFVSVPVMIFTAKKAPSAKFEMRSIERNPVQGFQPQKDRLSNDVYYVSQNSELDNRHIRKATVQSDTYGTYIDVQLTFEGAKRFEEFTKQRVGKHIGILLDGQLWTAPLIQTEITGDHLRISGFRDEREAEKVADGLDP